MIEKRERPHRQLERNEEIAELAEKIVHAPGGLGGGAGKTAEEVTTHREH